MSTNGKVLNDRIRLEIDASDLTNLVANHSAQTGNTTGWLADTGITLAAVQNPTRGSDTLAGTYTGGYTIRATYSTTAALTAAVRSPAFAVVPGRYVGAAVSLADSGLTVSMGTMIVWDFYNTGGTLIASTTAPTVALYGSGSQPTPWATVTTGSFQRNRTTVPSSPLVPAAAVTARLRIVFTDYDSGGNQIKPNRAVYITKLMVVMSSSLESVASVPFSDTTVWQNIVGTSTSVRINRGGDVEGVVDDIDPGSMTAVILDVAFDPAKNARARFGRRVRVSFDSSAAGATPNFRPIFTGRIASLDVTYAETKGQTAAQYRPTVTITATDAVTELLQVPAPYNYGGTFAEKARALMALTSVPFLADAGAASTTKISVSENASVWDQLILARNSFPTAKVFINRSGTAVVQSFGTPVAARHYAAKAEEFVVINEAVNPTFGDPNFGGAMLNVNSVRSTDWSGSGTQSLKLTANATTGFKQWYPSTLSATYGAFVQSKTSGYIAAAISVKAIAACRARLFVRTSDSVNGTEYALDLAAGEIADLKIVAHPIAAGYNLTDYRVFIEFSKPGTTTAWDTLVDIAYIDKIMMVWAANTTVTTALNGQYFDGDVAESNAGFGPSIQQRGDLVTEWLGIPHQSQTQARRGSALSYNDYTANLGTKSLVNSLVINKENSGETKAYGPYLNQASVVDNGTVSAEVTVVDGDPSTLAGTYLAKFANPNVFVSELEVNPTKADAWTAEVALTELYEAVTFQNSVSQVYGKLYVVGIDHDISPDDWKMKLTFRPVDQTIPVTATNGSGGVNAGPLDVIGPNGRATELPGSVNLNTITSPGEYAQTQNTEAASGLNYPVPQAGWLEVGMNTDQTMVWQRYTVYNTAGNYAAVTFVRSFYASAWTPWRTIGSAGTWTTLALAANFQAYPGGYQTPQYRVEGSRILLRGLVQTTIARTASVTFATLSGFPPAAQELFMAASNIAVTTGAASTGTAHTHSVGSLAARIDILTSGSLQVLASATQTFPVNGFFSLSGISWEFA